MYSKNWLSINFQRTFNAQNTTVNIVDPPNIKINWRNIVINRWKLKNGKIPYKWLKLTFDSFKIKCKRLFL